MNDDYSRYTLSQLFQLLEQQKVQIASLQNTIKEQQAELHRLQNRPPTPPPSSQDPDLFSAIQEGLEQLVTDVANIFTPSSTSGETNNPPAIYAGTFYLLPKPERFIDTRSGSLHVGELLGPIPSNTTLTLNITGRKGKGGQQIPAGAKAIVGNLAVTEPRETGWITIWPSGVFPETSNINFYAGQTVANSFVCGLSSDGQIMLMGHGTPHLVIDIIGFYI